MRRVWIEAARADEVREAAQGWAHAGAVDAPTLSAIETAYPASRSELHPAWKVLVFLLVCVALIGLFLGIFHGVHDILWPMALYAVALAIATEFLRRTPVSESGADAATSFVGLSFSIGAIAYSFDKWDIHQPESTTAVLAASAILWALAAWHWGFWVYAATGAAAGYLFIGRMKWARPTWVLLAVLLMAAIYRRFDRASLAPPHRRSLAAVFAVSAAALYTAVNLYSVDQRLVEQIRAPWLVYPVPPVLRLLAAPATAVLPVLFLAWGIRSRRRLLLGIGIGASVLSVATLRHYVPIGPRWAYLTACGAILVGGALWAHRRLRDAHGGAWRGLTAAPLYAVETEGGISPLGALGAHIAVPTAPEPERPGFTGGGGGFGGGGATGQY